MDANGAWNGESPRLRALAFGDGMCLYDTYTVSVSTWSSPVVTRLPALG